MSDKCVPQSIIIEGTEYVPKAAPAVNGAGLPYVIVRTYSAGVFAGYLQARNGQEVTLLSARRLWYWSGAASLSQLSVDGTKKPTECKFPVAVETIDLLQAIEIIPCTVKAKSSIESVPVWKA
jgi:hypothetical protein